jgi:hypothetical protein
MEEASVRSDAFVTEPREVKVFSQLLKSRVQ